MRRDAQARRDQIVAVAADLFEVEGYDLPLEAIAERAGVGRGTLYRNFQDRSALILAVVKLRVSGMFQAIDAIDDPLRAFLELLYRGGILSTLHPRKTMPQGRSAQLRDEWEKFDADTRSSIQSVLDKAIAGGSVRADLTCDDMMLIGQMLGSSLEGHLETSRDATIRRAVNLIFSGLRPGNPAIVGMALPE
jgi:AcrR family transcriptional regulator